MLKLGRRARGHFVTLIEIRVHLISVVQSYENCENYEIYENCEIYAMDERTNQVYSWYLYTVIMLIMATVRSGKPDYPGLQGIND